MIFRATSFLMKVLGSSCSFLKSILFPTNNLEEPFASSSNSGYHYIMAKTYLLSSIDEWVGICDCENDQENITMRICKGSQFGILFLSGSIPASKSSLPQAQINKGAINFYCCSIVVENGWNVIGGKLIFCIADEHTGLAYASISHSHYLNWNRVWHIMNIWSNYTMIVPLLYYHIL